MWVKEAHEQKLQSDLTFNYWSLIPTRNENAKKNVPTENFAYAEQKTNLYFLYGINVLNSFCFTHKLFFSFNCVHDFNSQIC